MSTQHDPLAAVKGILLACLFGAILWAAIGAVTRQILSFFGI